jgi:hypothetical protein
MGSLDYSIPIRQKMQSFTASRKCYSNYATHVPHTPIIKGFAKPLLWLQHLIVLELQKHEEKQVGWILCVFHLPNCF